MEINQLLALARKQRASDLHLSAGLPPLVRIDGGLQSLEPNKLTAQQVLDLILGSMDKQQQQSFQQGSEIDYCFTAQPDLRARMNAFWQYRGAAAACRLIAEKLPSLQSIAAPAIISDICQRASGLVLVCGATGMGKSTTLAAMLARVNSTQQRHIISIEDPIEFVYSSDKALINQRELNSHTQSFEQALRASLRADPDIIMLGELRDLATIRLALTAAETGHLVLATLHSASAIKAINRIIDVFSNSEKALIRSLLAESLLAIIAQRLVKQEASGRRAEFEILLANQAVRNLIRENKLAQIYSVMQTSQAQGMQIFV